MITEAPELERYEGKQIQRYTIFAEIAAGGMATVHLARLTGPAGFSRIVAMKRLHPHFSADPEFRAMLVDEAWLAARIRHPNVVPTLDVLVEGGDIFLVMEYIHGEPLSVLRRAAGKMVLTPSLSVCSAIMIGALQGLHAAHEARTETGLMLHMVHRDVSPQNIIVSANGVPMVIDFGVAKAIQTREETKPGVIKGKSGYMAPEQIRGEEVTRAADVFAAAVVLWELLTSRRLFGGGTELQRMNRVLLGTGVVPPSTIVPGIPAELDAVVMKGLGPEPEQRYESALDMADALERAVGPASQRTLAAWVRFISGESLARRAELLKEIEFSGVTAPAAAGVELEAATVVSPDHAGESDRPLLPSDWGDWRRVIDAGLADLLPLRRGLIGAGLGALLLLLLMMSTSSRWRHPRTAVTSNSSAYVVLSRPEPVVILQPSGPDPPPEKTEADPEAPALRSPARPTNRRGPRERAGAAPRSPAARLADPSRSVPARLDAKTPVPLVVDPPHVRLLE